MALCSESRGMSRGQKLEAESESLVRLMIFIIFFPSTKSDSLFPSRRFFFAFRAARLEAMPAIPERTFTMMSASFREASFMSVDFFEWVLEDRWMSFTLNFLACSFNRASLVLAARAITLKICGCFSKTSSVCFPREPVEPKITTLNIIEKFLFLCFYHQVLPYSFPETL